MRWAIGISIALHLLMLTLVFRGSHIDKKAYPPVINVHLIPSSPPLLGVQNPAVEQSTPTPKQQKKIAPPKEETRVAEVNPQKRPKRSEPKPSPPKEETAKVSSTESKSKGLPEGVQLGSEFGFAQLDATGFDSPIYLNVLFGKIRNAWENPYEGANKIQCTIYFVISRDGKITDSAVEKSSGIEAYDQAAQRAVLGSNPPPLPGQFGSDELGIHLEFQYLPNM
jgi:TonB family protein